MIAYYDSVVFIEGRDWIINVDMLDPLVRFCPLKRELQDRKEEAPDEDILLAPRYLDAINLVGPSVFALAAQDFAGESYVGLGDFAGALVEGEVDLEVKVRVAVQQRPNTVLDFQLVETDKEAGGKAGSVMAQRGPKTKPTRLKVLSGTARKHRLNAREPQPGIARPEAPDHLTPAARLEWDRVIEQTVTMGIMTELDRGALAAYCQAYGRWVSAETALAGMADRDAVTHGLIIRTKAGNAIQNPLVGAANKAMADMVRYAAEFGLTPSARARVAGIDPADGDDDPFAVFDTRRA